MVGVTSDVRDVNPEEGMPARVWLPLSTPGSVVFAVNARSDLAVVAETIRRTARSIAPDVPVEKLAAELKARGLKVPSMHANHGNLKKDAAAVIRDAKTLGATMIMVPWLTHTKEGLTEAEAKTYAADFNEFGAACKVAGIQFGYHPHGYEFTRLANGETAFDVLVRETKADLVSYQMDVFWAFHAGQDPVRLLQKYPNRWVSLHVKDIRKGAVTGLLTGGAPPTDNVTVGTGQIDWPAVLGTAQKIGVKNYFIEDETPTPLQCIPDSLKYLRGLKL